MAHNKNDSLPMIPPDWKPPNKRTGRRYQVTAQRLNSILHDYATTHIPLATIARNHRTSEQQIWAWVASFPELAEVWPRAQKLRAEIIVSHASDRFRNVEQRLEKKDVDYREIHARTNLSAAQARHDQWLAGKWNEKYSDRPADVHLEVNVSESLESAWDRRRAIEARFTEGETDNVDRGQDG